MPLLPWIADESLKSAVKNLLLTAKSAKVSAKKEFGKNVIDPFSSVFEIAGFETDFESWIKSETARQAQKTLQNHIGEFHQIILGSVKGWENKKTGNVIDLICKKQKILAEVKNKFNTTSGGKLADLYFSLERAVMPKMSVYKGYTAYYVIIIPKKKNRYNKEFTPSSKESGQRCTANEKIREIDGASFYTLVTGRENALEELFDILPQTISLCSNGAYKIKSPEKLKKFFSLAYEKSLLGSS